MLFSKWTCTCFFVVIWWTPCWAVDGSSLEREVDFYLKRWYLSRLETSFRLARFEHRWTTGALWWRKTWTVDCPKGLVDLTEARFSRVANVSWALVNSSRPWITVNLGSGGEGR